MLFIYFLISDVFVLFIVEGVFSEYCNLCVCMIEIGLEWV